MISTTFTSKTVHYTTTPTASTVSTSVINGSKVYETTSTGGGGGRFSLKNLPESMSPLSVSNIHFSEDIGPIPPPRMFSDAVISALQAANATVDCKRNGIVDTGDEQEENEENRVENGNTTTTGTTTTTLSLQPLINQLSNLNINNYLNGDNYFCDANYYDDDFDYDEWSSPFVEEVPAYEPKLTAMPKKSALKKSKYAGATEEENGVPESLARVAYKSQIQSIITNGLVLIHNYYRINKTFSCLGLCCRKFINSIQIASARTTLVVVAPKRNFTLPNCTQCPRSPLRIRRWRNR